MSGQTKRPYEAPVLVSHDIFGAEAVGAVQCCRTVGCNAAAKTGLNKLNNNGTSS